MSTISDDIRQFLGRQRLGFVATVNEDGTPNVSPKGTVRAFDDEHLFFGDIRSPQTIRNIEHNDAVEINVVDVASRTGFRFSGHARVHRDGETFDEGVRRLRADNVTNPIGAIVLVRVTSARPVTSPSYDEGSTAATLIESYAPYWHDLWRGIPLVQETRGAYEISTDRARLDREWITKNLAATYWARGIPIEVVRRSIAGSLCFGIYHERQVGFARVVTDYATFAWLADVFIDEEHRGQGLATWLTETALRHPSLQGLRRWMLATRDAHEVYARAGFRRAAKPEIFMERHDPDVYTIERVTGDG